MRVLLIVNTLPPTDVSGVGEQVLQLAAELWGDQPTLSMLAGAIVIVLSGIMLLSTERRRKRIASLLPNATE